MTSLCYVLEKKSGCFKGLNWHFSYINTTFFTCDLLSSLAKSKGWIESIDSLYPKVITYISNTNHRIIIVPETGRIDIRIHYTTPDLQRTVIAHQLAKSLVEFSHASIEENHKIENKLMNE